MNKEAREKLNRLILKNRIKFYAAILIPLILILGLFGAFFPVSSSNIEVKVIKYTARLTDFGNKPIMWAKLDNGKTIKITMPINSQLKQGASAEIIISKTLVGVPTYKFVRYVN